MKEGGLLYVVISQECDSVISDVLAEAEAQDYASHFARHRITWEMLKTMTDKELKEVRGTKCNLVSSQPRFQGLSVLPNAGRRETLGTRLRRQVTVLKKGHVNA